MHGVVAERSCQVCAGRTSHRINDLFLLANAIYLFAANLLGIFLATPARSIPQFGLFAIPVIIPMLLLSSGSTPLASMQTGYTG